MPPEDTVAVQSYSDCLELKGTFLSYMQDRKKKGIKEFTWFEQGHDGNQVLEPCPCPECIVYVTG